MRSKGTETGDTLEGDPPEDESGVSSSVPSGGVSRWATATPISGPSSSEMLYVNLEEAYPPSPPFLERDPNMSSAARYSPLHAAANTSLPSITLQNYHQHHLAKTPVPHFSLNGHTHTDNHHIQQMQAADPSPYLAAYPTHVGGGLHPERLPTLLQAIEDVTCSSDAVQHDGSGADFYQQQVFTSAGDAFGVSSSGGESGNGSSVFLPPHSHSHSAAALPSSHLLDAAGDLQLVLSSDGEYHMIDGSGMKTEHVELLITGGQSGVSYSLSSENGFIVARPTVTGCSPDKNTDVVMEADTLSVDVSVLDSLDEGSQFGAEESIVMETESLENNLQLDIGQSDQLVMSHGESVSLFKSAEEIENDQMTTFDITEYFEEEDDDSHQEIKRGRKQIADPDMSITCIPDKSVPCRARASLPASHLWLGEQGGVFAKRRIPTRARFGPLEGVRRRLPSNFTFASSSRQPLLLLHCSGEEFIVDVSDEKTSNWMRYVRFEPGPLQNVFLQQVGESLYFTSSKPIAPRSELLLGYGAVYASRWELPASILNAPSEDDPNLEWPCYECPMRFATSPLLQAHLNMHDDEDEKSVLLRKARKRTKPTNPIENRCKICNRVFPRIYSLKRHMSVHFPPISVDSSTTTSPATNITDELCDSDAQFNHLPLSETLNIKDQAVTVKVEPGNVLQEDRQIRAGVDCEDSQWNDLEDDVKQEIQSSWNASPENVPTKDIIAPGPLPVCVESVNSTIEEDAHSGRKENILNKANSNKVLTNFNSRRASFADVRTIEKAVKKSDDEIESTVNGNRLPQAAKISAEPAPSPLVNPPALVKFAPDQWKAGKCPICPMTFSRHSDLKEHAVNVHCRPDGLYDCPRCEKRFRDYKGVRKHMRAFHGVQSFCCSQCDTKFTSGDKLRLHLLRHSDHREFLCPDCGKQFKRKDKLTHHIKRQHNSMDNANEGDKPIKLRKNIPSPPSAPSDPSAYLLFTFKCHPCRLGFKRRGMLVNHLARRHPEISRASVPELQLPILRAERDYFCQHCDKVYKSSSKRKAHILKNHPGESVPPSNRGVSAILSLAGNGPTGGFTTCVGAVPSSPHHCPHSPCHKQYASKAKLLQHIRHKHSSQLANDTKENSISKNTMDEAEMKMSAAREADTHSSHAPVPALYKISKWTKGSDTYVPAQQPSSAGPVSKTSSGTSLLPTGSTSTGYRNNLLAGLLTDFSSYSQVNSAVVQNGEKHLQSRSNERVPVDPGCHLGNSNEYPAVERKSNADSTVLLQSLKDNGMKFRLVRLADTADETDMKSDTPQSRETGGTSVENDKLPPVSVLAGARGASASLSTRYTDR